ncbi:MAG: hypothetical protein ACLQVI_40840 [Polyangiaceae bacterium]
MEPRPGASHALGFLASLVSAASAVAIAFAGTANAQGPDANGLFDYGLAEMLAGRYATGCPALDGSFRLDPRPGTLFTLADCDLKWGKTASALARFGEFVALYERMPADQKAKQRERATVAASERATLEKSVPLLAVRLPNDAPAGSRVWRDDVEVTGPELAAAVPVDPGEHVIRVELPDGRTKEQRVSLANGEQRMLVAEIPQEKVEAAPLRPPIAVPAPTPPPVPAQVPPPLPAAASHAGWTYAAAGLGAASLIVAGVTGGVALGQKSIASPVCDASGECTTAQGANAGNLAHTMADVETGALVVGGVALVVAIVLWGTEPRVGSRARAASVRWTPGGVAVARW